jgi:subtilisin family serine protease
MHNTGQSGGLEDADIDAPEAWDLTTGGVNALGDEIVVAIVDGGCLLSHNDLNDNLWINEDEIPGNGIDDDNDGYVDDINGWNAYNSNGSISSDGHGTHVAGIVGAEGNNGSMVAGVNWDVKLMIIMGSSGNTSTVLEAYGYALDQRALYNETNGEEGAFVVATNSSFGVDFADCTSGNYPLWDEAYTAMGEAGILSAAATINANQNVDNIGDVPTGCTSDYLVTVTNTNRHDQKASAGYGVESIDLGAPGSSILSTYSNGSTSSLSGTSMATPHVAGAVGFLHSVMTSGFSQFQFNSPGEGALALKSMIMEGTDVISALENITVSGGRLNLFNSAMLVSQFMASDSLDPNPITNFTGDGSGGTVIQLSWENPISLFGGDTISDFINDLYRDGTLIESTEAGITNFVDTPVFPGTFYEYTVITRLIENDSTSVPVNLIVVAESGDCQLGDPNMDDIINVMDIIATLRFIMEWENPTPNEFCAADVDFDNTITVYDLLLISDIILGD